jgi:hypothetical protein
MERLRQDRQTHFPRDRREFREAVKTGNVEGKIK